MFKVRPLSGLAVLAVLSACSDSGVTNPNQPSGPSFSNVSTLSVPSPATVVVAGADAGAFTNDIVADNSLRATTEFWDNLSADNVAPTTSCNVGFFATGNMGPGCTHETATTDANQGGFTKYWGDGAEGRDPSSFMFNGAYSYNVKLLATFAGEQSEMGWFTNNGGYVFHPISEWGNKVINSEVTINTGGDDWGFYIRNTINSETGGCSSPEYDCSDATGGFSAAPRQHFALMINADGTRYLVGTEDQPLQLLSSGSTYDSDYNDYIFDLQPTAPELLNGRMTGGGGKVVSDGGADVTYGLTLHCDITLSNNLEINWGGHHWHLDKPITLADCQDNPEIEPHPPVAPFDTFNGEGYGNLDGVSGYKVIFTFVDDGEGANSGDLAGFSLIDPDGSTVVLNVPLQSAATGNIQAHYDQPHGQKP